MPPTTTHSKEVTIKTRNVKPPFSIQTLGKVPPKFQKPLTIHTTKKNKHLKYSGGGGKPMNLSLTDKMKTSWKLQKIFHRYLLFKRCKEVNKDKYRSQTTSTPSTNDSKELRIQVLEQATQPDGSSKHARSVTTKHRYRRKHTRYTSSQVQSG